MLHKYVISNPPQRDEKSVLAVPRFLATLGMTVSIACAILTGCTQTSSTSDLPTLTLAGEEFYVEIADTPAERQQGLMHRTELAPDRGMLFIFAPPRQVSFWMKNTLIPLDILYFDTERNLLQIYADTPPCPETLGDDCPRYVSESFEIAYVLELPAGRAAEIGAKIGDSFSLTE